jgi:acyl-CoA synthetase (NDP forming)
VHLEPLLRPASVAVVGATPTEGAFGRRLLGSVLGWRYSGRVFAINAKYDYIDGVKTYPTLAECPSVPELAAFAISDDRIEAAIDEAARTGVKAAVISGRCYGSSTTGVGSKFERIRKAANEAGITICGSNCVGFINFVDGLKLTPSPPDFEAQATDIGFVSQSGSAWCAVVGSQRQLPFAYAVSSGREINTTLAGYLAFMLQQPDTKVVGCIVETVWDPEEFVAALEAAGRRSIPIAVLRIGKTSRAQNLTAAHTGGLAGNDSAFSAICRRHDVALCESLDELTSTLEMFACRRPPAPGGLGVVMDSGGERHHFVDLAAAAGCQLAEFASDTQASLTRILDPGLTAENPVDTYGDGRVVLKECLGAVAEDPGVAIVVLSVDLVQGQSRIIDLSVNAAISAATTTSKPVVVLPNLVTAAAPTAARLLRLSGTPVLYGTQPGLSALKHFLHYHRRRRFRTPRRLRPTDDWRRRVLDPATWSGPTTAALDLLAAHGVPVAPGEYVSTLRQALAAAARVKYPVVLKTRQSSVIHKTDVGGVVTNLHGSGELRSAYRALRARFGPQMQVQKQIDGGIELLVGMTNDRQFGPIMTLAPGGVFVGICGTSVHVVPPIGAAQAMEAVKELGISQVFGEFRGRPRVRMEHLCEVISTFSSISAALGDELEALEINPLIVTSRGAIAVDARAFPIARNGRERG